MCHDHEGACGGEELALFQTRMVCDGLVCDWNSPS